MKQALLVLAVLAMASPAWGDGISIELAHPDPVIAAQCDPGYDRVGDTCVNMNPADDRIVIYQVRGHDIVYCTDPMTVRIGDHCVPLAVSRPSPCDPGYALLAYPGTWTLVCARDLREPK